MTVMGIGLHGGAVETIKWLSKQGAQVTATDIGKKEVLEKSLKKLKGLKNIKIITDQHRPEDFSRADLVVKNPAVPWTNKYIKIALEKNIPVKTDADLFFENCSSEKIIGVTGTKGKTTTALLIYEILKNCSVKVVKVGIGQEAVLDKLEKIDKDTFVIFELSSWRLSGLSNIKKGPAIAVISNIYPDHLNYYFSMQEYVNDKKNIFKYQKKGGLVVANWDNEGSREMASEAKNEIIYFSLNKNDKENCVFIEEGKIFFKKDGDKKELMLLDEIKKTRGHHNISNILSALAVAVFLKADFSCVKKALMNFTGVPHRLEFVGEKRGVKFYNDSASTMPQSSVAGISAFLKNIWLICGGASKNLDLSPLAEKISKTKYVKGVFLLKGTATEELEKIIKETGGKNKIIGNYDDIETVVEDAFEKASDGEVVLLSPGCASFGMFKNEFDRGDKFKEAVKKITS